ncbi:hypothetical protein AB0F15_21890 [Amycolatopsis sp. NPDC026612]|uniref:hypothetical protein n=1 Tax=Amycolatopsis sp. NPDC026612 TaxID=3155466 RepID=UPI0033E0439F
MVTELQACRGCLGRHPATRSAWARWPPPVAGTPGVRGTVRTALWLPWVTWEAATMPWLEITGREVTLRSSKPTGWLLDAAGVRHQAAAAARLPGRGPRAGARGPQR